MHYSDASLSSVPQSAHAVRPQAEESTEERAIIYLTYLLLAGYVWGGVTGRMESNNSVIEIAGLCPICTLNAAMPDVCQDFSYPATEFGTKGSALAKPPKHSMALMPYTDKLLARTDAIDWATVFSSSVLSLAVPIETPSPDIRKPAHMCQSLEFQPATFSTAFSPSAKSATSRMWLSKVMTSTRVPGYRESLLDNSSRCISLRVRKENRASILSRAAFSCSVARLASAVCFSARAMRSSESSCDRLASLAITRPIATSPNTPTATSIPPVTSRDGSTCALQARLISVPNSITNPITTIAPKKALVSSSLPRPRPILRFGFLIGPFIRRNYGARAKEKNETRLAVILALVLAVLVWILFIFWGHA
jgi:hypothetical protein